MNMVKSFLKFISGGKAAPQVKIGQKWCLDSQTKNPYDRNLYTVVVKGVRNGWVKWEHVVNPSNGGSDTIDHFRWLYDLLPDEKEENLFCGHPKTMAICYPGGKPYCSVCREFVEEKDRREFADWNDKHMKPIHEAMKRFSELSK